VENSEKSSGQRIRSSFKGAPHTTFGSVMLSAEASRHFSALIELSNAEILRFAQNDRRWRFPLLRNSCGKPKLARTLPRADEMARDMPGIQHSCVQEIPIDAAGLFL
jgi:hypothetical protein